MTLNRADFLNAPIALATESVPVPGLNGEVIVSEMTAGERDIFEDRHAKAGSTNFRARLVIATARDHDGHHLFVDNDLAALTNLPAATLDPIVSVAVRINKLSSEDVKELAKN